MPSRLKYIKQGRYELSKKMGYRVWSLENISNRQKYLAKQAKAIWSIPYTQN
jgi:hypothetical protein